MFGFVNQTRANLRALVYCDQNAPHYAPYIFVKSAGPDGNWDINIASRAICQAVQPCAVPASDFINGPWPMFQATAARVGQIGLVGAQTCTVAWKVFVGSAITGSPIIGPGGHIYVGTIGHNLFRIDAATGTVAWRTSFEGAVNTITIAKATPLGDGNHTLYVPTLNKLIAIDASTQAEMWRFEHPNLRDRCLPAVFSDFYYYFTGLYFICGPTLYFANAQRGRIEWNYTVPENEGSLSGLAVGPVDGRIYVGSKSNLYSVDASSGVPVATIIYKMGVVGIPTVSNHGLKVYFQGTDNYTYAIDSTSGALEWKENYGGGISSSAISPDCSIVLGE